MPPLYVRTPTWESRTLAAVAGATVYLKMESFQPSGSFKARGMGVACQAAFDAGARGLVCASGGNAGLAVAYAGRVLGLPTRIVVPQTASQRAKDLIQREGAEVIVHGAAWDESQVFALALAERQGAACIHPFDDPTVWAGHATMIHEAAQDGPRPGAGVVSVGGGGLLIGMLQGMHDVGWADVPVLAVETRGADSFAQSVAAGELVTLDRITSLATTLGARRVAPEALAWTHRHPITPWVVSDREAVDACFWFADEHRVLVEPSCGASLAAVLEKAAPLAGRGPILIIVCGGAGVTLDLLQAWRARAG